MRWLVPAFALVGCGLALGSGCKRFRNSGNKAAPSSSVDPSTLAPPPLAPTPPHGMVWIPPGTLIAGTPPGRLPRMADEEMPGEQVVLKGYFIDVLPYPNEEGAIPKTGVTQQEAELLCEQNHKRLCTELEWERACKGPRNHVYPYGDKYRERACDVQERKSVSVRPNGLLPACKSSFGVRDTHGSVWQWTSSPWGRGTMSNDVTLRGGTGKAGEVIGRCANARARKPSLRTRDIGFRCCKGDRNLAEVTINIVKGTTLRATRNERWLREAMLSTPPPAFTFLVPNSKAFRVLKTWRWRPIGNEELVLQSGCAPKGAHGECGVVIGRAKDGALEPLGYASSGWWLPNLRHDQAQPRELYIFGGDVHGGYRRRIRYNYGRISITKKQRNGRRFRK